MAKKNKDDQPVERKEVSEKAAEKIKPASPYDVTIRNVRQVPKQLKTKKGEPDLEKIHELICSQNGNFPIAGIHFCKKKD